MVNLLFFLFVCLPPQEEGEILEWVEQLGADYQEERVEAAKKLEKVGKKAESQLIEGIEHEDYRVRGSCIRILTLLKSPSALEPVGSVFRNPEEDLDVQQKAFSYLINMGKGAEDNLIEALDRSRKEFRLGALMALRKMKSTKCAGRVAQLYEQEEEKVVKAAAFECLKNLGKVAQPYLLDLLASQDSMVREGAITGLRNINVKEKDPVVVEKIGILFCNEVDRSALLAAFRFLRECGPLAEPHFVAGLKSIQENVQEKSLEGLIKLKGSVGLERTVTLFQSTTSENIRLLAKNYMEILGKVSEPHFVQSLQNPKSQVKLLAVDALGKMKSEAPHSVISEMFRREKDLKVHQASFQYLVRLGEKAEEDLIFALKDKDKSIRVLAIKAVGKIRSEKAIPDLLSTLGTLDADLENAAIHSLAQIGEKAVKAVEGEVEAGRVESGVGEKVGSLYAQQQVEELLSQFVSDDGGFGYYEGMFGNLKTFGIEKALPVLHRIIEDSSYRSRLDSFKGNRDQFTRALRELSIMAIGDLGDKESIPRLKKALKTTTSFGFDDEHSHLIVALYKVGDRDSFKTFVARLEKEASKAFSTDLKEDGYEKLFSIGLVQNRVGQQKAAAEVYENLVDRIEKAEGGRNLDVYPDTLYNLACLQTLAGEKKRALKTLRKAVEAGFTDKGWIEKDGDLQSLREEEGYRALMAEKALFERN